MESNVIMDSMVWIPKSKIGSYQFLDSSCNREEEETMKNKLRPYELDHTRGIAQWVELVLHRLFFFSDLHDE
jgi:hypothetical protein